MKLFPDDVKLKKLDELLKLKGNGSSGNNKANSNRSQSKQNQSQSQSGPTKAIRPAEAGSKKDKDKKDHSRNNSSNRISNPSRIRTRTRTRIKTATRTSRIEQAGGPRPDDDSLSKAEANYWIFAESRMKRCFCPPASQLTSNRTTVNISRIGKWHVRLARAFYYCG